MTIANATVNSVKITSGTSINITTLEVQSTADLYVYKVSSAGVRTDLVITTDYTVNAGLTTITLLVALGASEFAVASYGIDMTQDSNFTNSGAFNVETLEDNLDKLTLAIKEDRRDIARGIKFALETELTDIDVPDMASKAGYYLKVNDTEDGLEWVDGAGPTGATGATGPAGADGEGAGDALVANPLSQFAATTSSQLAGVISDETGSGALVFATSPTLVTPVLGVATATSVNGCTLTSGTLNGSVTGTNTGDQTTVTGNSGTTNALVSATTTVNVSSATAPTTGQVLTATGDSAATWQTPAGGSSVVVQVKNATYTTVGTTTTQMPADGTIPQNTEGAEFMSLAITPTSATNKLLINVVVFLSHTASSQRGAALFQDSTANAIAAAGSSDASYDSSCISYSHYMTAGTTSATTFKVRCGANSAGTLTFNGVSGSVSYGTASTCSITITEIAV